MYFTYVTQISSSDWCQANFSGHFLLQLPTIIADNAGYDSADLVAQLRAAHQENKTNYGLSE